MGILPVTQLHCVPCGLAHGQSLDQTRKFKMGPKTFNKSTQIFSTKKPYLLTYKQLQTSVSNGTGQCNFSGQRDKSSFIVPGQRDNGISSKSCCETGQADSKSKPGTGHGTGQGFDMLPQDRPGRDFDSLSRPGKSRDNHGTKGKKE